MTVAAELFALQEIDLALEAGRSALADIEMRLGEPEELLDARRVAEERREAARAAEKQFKEREFEADELRQKIEPIEKKLYQGSVHNPKELEDLQRDLDSLKRRRGELEDRALEAMEGVEAAQRSLADAQRTLDEVEQARTVELRELAERRTDLDREILALEGRRDGDAADIEPRLLNLYDRIAGSRGGRAVAKVEGGACQGCRISLPTNLVQRARSSGDPVQCSSCERILYVS